MLRTLSQEIQLQLQISTQAYKQHLVRAHLLHIQACWGNRLVLHQDVITDLHTELSAQMVQGLQTQQGSRKTDRALERQRLSLRVVQQQLHFR